MLLGRVLFDDVVVQPGLDLLGNHQVFSKSPASFSFSSSMISLHSWMHSSQMYTAGPAISFLTSFWFFPQKEQNRLSLARLFWPCSCLRVG
jgi:hypothetical protein